MNEWSKVHTIDCFIGPAMPAPNPTPQKRTLPRMSSMTMTSVSWFSNTSWRRTMLGCDTCFRMVASRFTRSIRTGFWDMRMGRMSMICG